MNCLLLGAQNLEKDGLVSRSFLNSILNEIQNVYMSELTKKETTDFLKQFVAVNFGMTQMKKEGEEVFFKNMGVKYSTLMNRCHLKQQESFEHFEFIVQASAQQKIDEGDTGHSLFEFDYQKDERRLKKVAQITWRFCKSDLDAFSFISLHCIWSVKKILEKCKHSFLQVSQILQKRLKRLAQIYPQNGSYKINDVSNVETNLVKQLQSMKCTEYQKFVFKTEKQNHYQELKKFVIEKSKQASNDLTIFNKIVKKTCIQMDGYAFASNLKIKDETSKLSIQRTIEKLLQSSHQKQFKEHKTECLKVGEEITKKSKNKLQTFVAWEKQQAEIKMKKILEELSQVTFDAKDLVRGKCIFSKRKQVLKVIEQINKKILEQDNCKLLELKNELLKKNVVKLIIQLPNSIAELQLVVKLNKTSNEFNHKIYELIRSIRFSPLTSLYIHNEKWGFPFFSEQMKILDFMSTNQIEVKGKKNVNWGVLKQGFQKFAKRFLTSDLYEFALENQNQVLLKKKIDYPKTTKNDQQQFNEGLFFLSAHRLDLAKQIVSENQLPEREDQNILFLRGNVYQAFGNNKKALQNYGKCKLVQQKRGGQQSQYYAKILNNMGSVYQNKGNFKKALKKYKKCQKIWAKTAGKQSLDYAGTLNNIGLTYQSLGNDKKALKKYRKCSRIWSNLVGKNHLYYAMTLNNIASIQANQGHFQAALQNYEKSLYINQKQSLSYARLLNNIGLVNDKQGNYMQALQNYKKCLLIYQNLAGEESQDYATTLNNIGVLYKNQKNYQRALQNYEKSLLIRQKLRIVD